MFVDSSVDLVIYKSSLNLVKYHSCMHDWSCKYQNGRGERKFAFTLYSRLLGVEPNSLLIGTSDEVV